MSYPVGGKPVSRIRPGTVATPLLVLILGLPVVFAVAAFGAWEFAASIREATEAHLAAEAKSTAMALDAKLSGFEAAGLALAATDELQGARTPTDFHQEASRIGSLLGVHIVVQEAAPPGEAVLNTLLPPDAHAPPRDARATAPVLRQAVEEVIATGKPAVTNIYVGTVTHQRMLAVVVPIVTHDVVTRVLMLVFAADDLAPWLADQISKEPGSAGIRDGTGQIVAASSEPATFAGVPVPDPSHPLFGDHGIVEGVDQHGSRTLFGYQKLTLAPNYAVVVGRPVHGAMTMIAGPAKWLFLWALATIVLGFLSLVALWMRRSNENAALDQVNRMLSGLPAILYINRVYSDGRFRRRYISLSAEAVTGWSNKLLDREGSLADKIHPDFLEARRAFFLDALEKGSSQFEYRMRFADGTYHWMRSVAVRMQKGLDGSAEVVGFITDITGERMMREELRRTERFALLGEVAGRVSHEMNQPMAAISMAAENGKLALERSPVNLDLVRDKFIRIEEQVDRVIAVIGHIGTFSRRGAIADVTALDIRRVVQSSLAVAEPKLNSAGVSVDLAIPPRLPPPRGVAVLVEQILVNLIVNACDAYLDRPERKDRIVWIAASARDEQFVLKVSDKAGGIPKEMLETIFDPFVTSKPPGKGTGLGLSFCLASIARLGGTLTASNQDGGACFEVMLPIAARERLPAEAV